MIGAAFRWVTFWSGCRNIPSQQSLGRCSLTWCSTRVCRDARCIITSRCPSDFLSARAIHSRVRITMLCAPCLDLDPEAESFCEAAFERGWTDQELKILARTQQARTSAMPAATKDKALNRSLIMRSQIRMQFEKSRLRSIRLLRLLAKPDLTVKEAASLQREMNVLLREIADAKVNCLAQSLVPLR